MAKIPDLSSHIAALGSEDPQAQANAVNTLTTADVRGYPQDEQGTLNMANKVAALLSSSGNPALRAAAAKLAARMAQQFGAMQRALRTDTFLAALWAVLEEFGGHYEEYKAAIALARQPPPIDPKKPPPKGAPPPVIDLDANLPVPSKHCLEAVLRCLASLAAFSSVPAAWLCQNGQPQLLLPLLQHHSQRVQLRAVHCIRALGVTSSDLLSTLQVHDLVPDLVRMLRTSGSGAVMTAAAQALLHVCQQGPGAALTRAIEEGAVDTLLQLIVTPETLPVAPTPAAGAAAEEASRPGTATGVPAQAPHPIDYAKLTACRPQDLQQAAAALLLHLTTHSLEAASHLLAAGAPNLLLALLPSAPKPLPPADPANPAPPVPPTPEPPTPFFPLPAALNAPPLQEDQAAGAEGEEAEAQHLPSAAQAPEPDVLQRLAYPLPVTKATTHALQSSLLQLLALLLSDRDVQEAVWQASQASAPLVPFLVYFLAEPPAQPAAPEPTPAADVPAKGGKGAKEAKGGKPSSAKGTPRGAAAVEASAVDVSIPPFPSPVKVAAVRCLTQLARHPGLAAAISNEEAVKKLLASAASPASTCTAPADAAQAGATPEAPAPALSAAAAPSPSPSEPLGGQMAEAIAGLVQLMISSARDGGPEVASHSELVACVKGLAEAALLRGSPVACSNVVRTALMLPESDLVAQARPPPPSPPHTPPPLPLATSQFVWDALGRPNMIDGSNVKLVHL